LHLPDIVKKNDRPHLIAGGVSPGKGHFAGHNENEEAAYFSVEAALVLNGRKPETYWTSHQTRDVILSPLLRSLTAAI
jgi:hypothetical protein